ncbi:MAG: phospholipid/cholesterol/gamma-HCH transport system substrate-binding protein [Pseudonocardiales bacterium]|jgi:phospholipid/cholesterol/gamma-HCH transport system substrate-binding protein|nr:phospholipid/cholesterol/gamma-HCH transport system substrate-binding protein [Pseudonocardiales bacterium]
MNRGRAALAAIIAVALLAGCSFGLERLPAPSGTNGETYRLTAEFGDVQNLTLGAKVKLGGVVVGEVTAITTRDYQASVQLSIEKKFPLEKGARFQIRFTTPLGDDFVSVTSRGSTAAGRLADGATVGPANTSNAPGIEDTFAAVSLLLNGGGLSKLKIIVTELNAAFHGRTGDARDALVKLHTVITNLDEHKVDIDRTLDGLAKMSTALNKGTGVIEQALALFPPTLQTLADDTAQLRDLLQRVGKLGTTVDDLLRRGQSAMLADFANLRPTLDALRARQDQLLPTFDALIAVGKAVNRAAPGDYLNISATIQFLLEAPPAHPRPGGVVHPGAEATGPADAAVRRLIGAAP